MLTRSWHMHGLHSPDLRIFRSPVPPPANLCPNYGGKTCNSMPTNTGTSLPDGWDVRRYEPNSFWHIVISGSLNKWARTSRLHTTAPGTDAVHGRTTPRHQVTAGPYAYWCICYKRSPGHRTLDTLGATWHLHIPAGQLRMRYHSTITYSSPLRWAGMTNTNKVDILLGYIVSPDTNTSTLSTPCAQELQKWGQLPWVTNPPRNALPSPPPAYTMHFAGMPIPTAIQKI
ncbi:hypothetical protein H257_14667 [Aphanomyces astaci]|uniref:Uncharacterized protein n=1 Tax=Aphanomyces astaci TaxID=112090 RepID=W4FS50_APHAT|nr:hypothetical protein H257_14667 [Aphanomyces astaci]ETV69644.1 hypothetical protein H257_14667 [Aphanomyces astaci]|eukprot:XP_009840860.1 hypothetical protein H257_14667 [Aphanomyces astaci]